MGEYQLFFEGLRITLEPLRACVLCLLTAAGFASTSLLQ
jgi:hypothetical protein